MPVQEEGLLGERRKRECGKELNETIRTRGTERITLEGIDTEHAAYAKPVVIRPELKETIREIRPEDERMSKSGDRKRQWSRNVDHSMAVPTHKSQAYWE
jgi:hypothetical protein